MITFEVTEKERSDYKRFLREQKADVHQTLHWGDFWKKLPFKGRYWAFAAASGEKKDADWLGTVMVTRYSLPFGLSWFSVARGPVFAPGVDVVEVWKALMVEIRALAKKEKAVFVRVELPCGSKVELGRGWREAHAHYHPEWTLEVDLKVDEEAILAQMKQKGRYNIRLAEKKGVTVRSSHDPKDVLAFFKILEKTGGRDGFQIHEQTYYQTLVKLAHDDAWGKLYVAEYEGVIVSGIFVTFSGDTAKYYYGASDHEHRALMAPYLLQWTAMQEAKEASYKWYDFMGIAPPDEPDHAWVGITRFKEKFGGMKVEYPKARERVFKRFWYAIMRLRKSAR